MSQRIVIDPVSRIEGHAKITIHLGPDGAVDHARFHVAEFRGFERFCVGRPFSEMAGLSARICGICPVSHILASSRAGDPERIIRICMTTRTLVALLLTLRFPFAAAAEAPAPGDIRIADFVTGNAFGPGRGTLARENPVSGFNGRGLVNSYHDGDGTTGTLTAPEFTIERGHISLLVGCGGFAGETLRAPPR